LADNWNQFSVPNSGSLNSPGKTGLKGHAIIFIPVAALLILWLRFVFLVHAEAGVPR
jgi:hypothetical protein